MAQASTIRIFLPDGDPEGVRVVDRMNSPTKYMFFPRGKWDSIKGRSEVRGAGIYILAGYSEDEIDLPTVYIGQGDKIGQRIEEHLKLKAFWDEAIVVSSANPLNSTHARWLEHALIGRAREVQRSVLDNRTTPQEPPISEPERADMRTLLDEVYQTLPLVGINAFEAAEAVIMDQETQVKGNEDTIVVPAQKEGFEKVFLGENSWYAIRIFGGRLGRIRHIAAYQTLPTSAITHYAPVEKIEPYGDGRKYKVIFSEPAKKLVNPIILGKAPQGSMQGPRYTTLKKLLKAKKLSDL